MQYQKLTHDQRSIRQWRVKRNRILARIMAENPTMTTGEATKLANKETGRMPGKRVR